METKLEQKPEPEPAYLRPVGLYWRSVGGLLVFQAVGWACAAGVAYLILSPELAKDYFSAHRTVKATWQLVTPALAISAAIGFLLVGVGSAWSVWSYSRRVLQPLWRIDALLRGLGAGKIPRPDPAAQTAVPDGALDAAFDPLRDHVRKLRSLARDTQKVSLELNYRSAGTSEVTLKDLRALAAQLDALAKDLSRTSGWFEG